MLHLRCHRVAHDRELSSAPQSGAGFELSLIEDSYAAIDEGMGRGAESLEERGWETSPFLVFLRTIPGRFYPIAMLFLQVHAPVRLFQAS